MGIMLEWCSTPTIWANNKNLAMSANFGDTAAPQILAYSSHFDDPIDGESDD